MSQPPSMGQPHPPLHVREATLSDATEIAVLLTQLGYPSSREQVEHRLGALLTLPECRTLVAVAGSTVVGMAGIRTETAYTRDRPVGRLVALVTEEGWRGRGVGSLLLRATEEWLVQSGAERVVVNSATHRAEAHRFYIDRGYEITGVRLAKSLHSP